MTGRPDELGRAVERACDAEPTTPAAAGVRIAVMVTGATGRFHIGDFASGHALSERIDREAGPLIDSNPLVAAVVHRLKTSRAVLSGDVGAALPHWLSVAACFDAAGERRGACTARTNAGFSWMVLGVNAEAETTLRQALAEALALDLGDVAAAARHNLGLALARRGAIEEAIFEETVALDALRARGNARLAGGSRVYLSIMLLQAGDLARAEVEARQSVADLAGYPPSRPYAMAQLAQVLLARGGVDEALTHAESAIATLRAGPIDDGESMVRLTIAEALRAAGRESEAALAFAEAHERLQARAALISNASLREHFLNDVPENARTIALANATAFAG